MDKEDKGLLALLVLLGGILVVTFVVAYQVQQELRVVAQLRQEVGREREAQEQYEALLDEFSLTRSREADWRALLVSDEQAVAGFAAQLENLARLNGLTLTIQFEDLPGRVTLAGKEGLGLKFELTLAGSYEGITSFLRSLETSNYLVKQDRLQMSRQEDSSYILIMSGVLIMKQQ